MTKRTVFHVVYDRRNRLWLAKVRGDVVRFYMTKRAIIENLSRDCTSLKNLGYQSQIKIHDARGDFQSERTYGADPKRSRG